MSSGPSTVLALGIQQWKDLASALKEPIVCWGDRHLAGHHIITLKVVHGLNIFSIPPSGLELIVADAILPLLVKYGLLVKPRNYIRSQIWLLSLVKEYVPNIKTSWSQSCVRHTAWLASPIFFIRVNNSTINPIIWARKFNSSLTPPFSKIY